jgi:hypothetical protein
MLDMDGLKTTRGIRSLGGTRGRVPIVAMTAQAFVDQITECHKAGVNSRLAMPFDPATLAAAVAAGPGHSQGPHPVSVPNTNPAAALIAVMGSGLMVFDLISFERTTGFLEAGVVASHLRTIKDAVRHSSAGCESSPSCAPATSSTPQYTTWRAASACSASNLAAVCLH